MSEKGTRLPSYVSSQYLDLHHCEMKSLGRQLDSEFDHDSFSYLLVDWVNLLVLTSIHCILRCRVVDD